MGAHSIGSQDCTRHRHRDELLFPGDDGGHLKRPHPESGWFAKAVITSGVPRVTRHDLRHTAASLAVSAGANVKQCRGCSATPPQQ